MMVISHIAYVPLFEWRVMIKRNMELFYGFNKILG